MHNTVYLMDLSYWLYKYHFVLKNLSAEVDGEVILTGAFYGPLRYIFSLLETNPQAVMVIADENYNDERKEMHPEYKSGRKSIDFSTFRGEIHDICRSIPRCMVASNPNMEADDIIGVMCHRFKSDMKKIILSIDNDFLQLMELENVFLSPKPKLIHGEEYIHDKYGVDRHSIHLYRIMQGDTSDKIPKACPRVPTTVLQAAALKEKTLKNLLNNMDRYPQIRYSMRDQLKKNHILMRLPEDGDVTQYQMDTNVSVGVGHLRKYLCNSLVLRLESLAGEDI